MAAPGNVTLKDLTGKWTMVCECVTNWFTMLTLHRTRVNQIHLTQSSLLKVSDG